MLEGNHPFHLYYLHSSSPAPFTTFCPLIYSLIVLMSKCPSVHVCSVPVHLIVLMSKCLNSLQWPIITVLQCPSVVFQCPCLLMSLCLGLSMSQCPRCPGLSMQGIAPGSQCPWIPYNIQASSGPTSQLYNPFSTIMFMFFVLFLQTFAN